MVCHKNHLQVTLETVWKKARNFKRSTPGWWLDEPSTYHHVSQTHVMFLGEHQRGNTTTTLWRTSNVIHCFSFSKEILYWDFSCDAMHTFLKSQTFNFFRFSYLDDWACIRILFQNLGVDTMSIPQPTGENTLGILNLHIWKAKLGHTQYKHSWNTVI